MKYESSSTVWDDDLREYVVEDLVQYCRRCGSEEFDDEESNWCLHCNGFAPIGFQ